MELILHIRGSISPASLLHLNLLLFIFFSYSLTWNITLLFLLQLNMESCFSADTPPLSGIHIKQLSPHLYMALFPQIIITPLSDTYSFSTIPPLYDTIFYILRGYYPTFICGFTAASVPTFIWHFFITSHTDTCSAEGIFYTHLYL